MDVQSAANLNIPEGSVRNIHDKDKRLLWSAVGYNVRYDGDTTQQTYTGKNICYDIQCRTTNSIQFFFPKTLKSSTITISTVLNVATASNTISLWVDNSNIGNIGTFSGNAGETISRTFTFTSSQMSAIQSGSEIYLQLYKSNAGFTLPTWAQIEIGSTATSYEPYVGGIPAPNPDYPQAVNVVKGAQSVRINSKNWTPYPYDGTGNGRGITFSADSSGIVTLNGQNDNTGQSQFFVYDYHRHSDKPYIIPAGTYYLIKPNNDNLALVFYDGATYRTLRANSNSMTLEKDTSFLQIYLAVSKGNTTVFSNFKAYSMLSAMPDLTDDDFEPYQGQTFPVDLIGKNLFSGWTIGKKLNGSGVETTDQNGAVSDFIPVVPDTNYIFSDLPDGLYTFIAAYNSQKQFLGRTGASGGSSSKGCKTLPSYFSYGTPAGTGDVDYLRVTAYQSGTYADPISVVSSLQTQLEVGTSATPYVPYYNYELCKFRDYQDYIYKGVDGWYVHKDMGKVILDGTGVWNPYTYHPAEYTYMHNVDGARSGYRTSICSHFTNVDGAWQEGVGQPGYYSDHPTLGRKYFVSDKTTVSDFTTWLSNHNVLLRFALETPTDTKITDSTLVAQLDAIHDWLTRYDYYPTVTGDLPIVINRVLLT